MSKVYSNAKLAWHLEDIAKLREGKDIIPKHVQIILSDLCNQDCSFCAYRMSGGFSTENFPDEAGNRNPNRMLPTKKVIEILDDCKKLGVGAIQFTGGGEPTVHPDWRFIFNHAQQLGLKTALVTNGVLLKDCPEVRNLDWLRISLDAGREDTYVSIRKSQGWTKVQRQFKWLGQAIASQGKMPYVGVGFVITPDNYMEIYKAAELVKNYSIPYLRLSAVFSSNAGKEYRDIHDYIVAEIRKTKAYLEDDHFSIVDLYCDRLDDLDLAAPDYSFCGAMQFTLYIGGDQKVYSCCTNAYTTHGEIGDLSQQTFAEWLTSTRRYDFDVSKCHHCQFNEKNRLANYLINPDPIHVDFV